MYAIALTAAGAVSGALFATAGAGVALVWPGMTLPLAVALGAVAFAYALHELDFVQLPVPGRDWQVPNSWLKGGFYRSAAIFGSLVGSGVFTRIPYASLPILLAWIFISGNVFYGALIGLVYGAERAASIYSSATTQDAGEVVELNQRLMTWAAPAHQVTGLFLAAFAAYLIAAPYLP